MITPRRSLTPSDRSFIDQHADAIKRLLPSRISLLATPTAEHKAVMRLMEAVTPGATPRKVLEVLILEAERILEEAKDKPVRTKRTRR